MCFWLIRAKKFVTRRWKCDKIDTLMAWKWHTRCGWLWPDSCSANCNSHRHTERTPPKKQQTQASFHSFHTCCHGHVIENVDIFGQLILFANTIASTMDSCNSLSEFYYHFLLGFDHRISNFLHFVVNIPKWLQRLFRLGTNIYMHIFAEDAIWSIVLVCAVHTYHVDAMHNRRTGLWTKIYTWVHIRVYGRLLLFHWFFFYNANCRYTLIHACDGSSSPICIDDQLGLHT